MPNARELFQMLTVEEQVGALRALFPQLTTIHRLDVPGVERMPEFWGWGVVPNWKKLAPLWHDALRVVRDKCAELYTDRSTTWFHEHTRGYLEGIICQRPSALEWEVHVSNVGDWDMMIIPMFLSESGGILPYTRLNAQWDGELDRGPAHYRKWVDGEFPFSIVTFLPFFLIHGERWLCVMRGGRDDWFHFWGDGVCLHGDRKYDAQSALRASTQQGKSKLHPVLHLMHGERRAGESAEGVPS